MPKRMQKSREESSAEGYFPVDEKSSKRATEKPTKEQISREDILKRTTEKPVKYKETQQITINKSVEKKRTKKSRTSQKPKRTTEKKVKALSIPKSLMREDSYELIITEKPQAATKISAALGVSSKRILNGVPYYEVDRENKKIVVACAVGHLFSLKQNSKGTEVPNFDISWVPNFEIRKKDFSKKYYQVLKTLSKNAKEFTVATDFDIEGELIGTNVVKFICNKEDAKRMKFSTLTNKELDEAYRNKLPNIHWGQAIAGETRHYLDWYYGINLSRALMNAIKTTGKFKIMSIGRVQGPSLNLIVKKEKQIKKFEPRPYWQVFIELKEPKIELKYTKDIFDEKQLKKFEELKDKKVKANTKKSKRSIPPNPPFNLTTLQTESYKLYGITPSRTLQIAQSLYLAGLISYPRTSSQKLPESIDYKSIIKELKKTYKVGRLLKRKKPLQGKKTDPAHPSIYPTGNKQILSGEEEKIYELIVKRFLCLFCDDAKIDRKRISVKENDLEFTTNGSEIKEKNWLELYPIKIDEKDLPDVEGEVEISEVKNVEKETTPPKRYSQASIISEMEKRNLGTKATRSNIIETLYNRGYIRENSMQATALGISLIDTLEKYSPIIIDDQLTTQIQNEMDEITETKDSNLQEREQKILSKAKESIKKIAQQFKENENKIGAELINAQEKQRKIEKKENTLNKCPKCKKGNLAITYSPKNRRFFIACDAYPECRNTYPLPKQGIFKRTEKTCESCGFPMLISLRKGKKPWIFCFNTECKTNESWAKK